MAGINEALERLVTDPAFREQLRADPATALSGFVLDDEDIEILAASLDDSAGERTGVEQRTSKVGLFAALAGFADSAGTTSPVGKDETITVGGNRAEAPSGTRDQDHGGEIDIESWSWGETQSGASAQAAKHAGPIKVEDIVLKRGVTDDAPVDPGGEREA